MIPEDFRSKHSILVVHLWIIHKRLLQEGKRGQFLQECLFDTFWEDSSNRIRELGVNELQVNKMLSQVQGFTFKTCLEFDHALMKTEEAEVLEELGGALWRSVYSRSEDINPEHIMDMRREHLFVSKMSSEDIMRGHVEWSVSSPPWVAIGDEVKASHESHEKHESHDPSTFTAQETATTRGL